VAPALRGSMTRTGMFSASLSFLDPHEDRVSPAAKGRAMRGLF